MKILIVDDEYHIRLLIKDAIETSELDDEILEAENGLKALKIIEKSPVDLIITDLVMPKLSGLDLIKRTKENYPFTEVIVITGYATLGSAVEALRNGARDYLQKPINIEVLLAKINNIRDYVNRLKEIEDYRFAKDMVETKIAKSFHELESGFIKYKTALKNIKDVLNEEISSEKKIESISKILKETD